jgi:hypothetical protein
VIARFHAFLQTAGNDSVAVEVTWRLSRSSRLLGCTYRLSVFNAHHDIHHTFRVVSH